MATNHELARPAGTGPAEFISQRDPRGWTVEGFDIHVGASRPMLEGYEQVLGAAPGSGPAAMSFDIDDAVFELLQNRFSSWTGMATSTKLDDAQARYATMLYPALRALACELQRQFPADHPASRMAFGPVWHIWWNAAAAHSSNEALGKWIRTDGNFESLAAIADAIYPWELAWHPGTPYTVDQQRYWRKTRLCSDRFDDIAFREAMRVAGLSHTRGQGMFPTGVTPDPCTIQADHVAQGDGTSITRPTDVTSTIVIDAEDPFSGQLIVTGSRAANPHRARVDSGTQRAWQDAKDADTGVVTHGRNHAVTMSRVVGKANSRVVLDVAAVPLDTNEEAVARPMVVALAETTEGALFHYAHDMALLPASRTTILRDSAVVVVNRNKTYLDAAFTAARDVVGQVYGLTELSARRVRATKPQRNKSGGTKAQPSSALRKTTHGLLGTVVHTLDDGTRCRHLLAGDDGRLVEVLQDHLGTDLWFSEPVPGPYTGSIHRWTGTPDPAVHAPHITLTRYDLACPHATGPVMLWFAHAPTDLSGDDLHPVENYIRAIPEGTDDFDYMFGIRQDTEAFNSLLAASLRNDRAPYLDERSVWWSVVGFAIGHNADNWVRETRLHINDTPIHRQVR